MVKGLVIAPEHAPQTKTEMTTSYLSSAQNFHATCAEPRPNIGLADLSGKQLHSPYLLSRILVVVAVFKPNIYLPFNVSGASAQRATTTP